GRPQLTLQQVSQPQLRQWLQVIERAALDGAQTVRRLQEFTRIRRDQPFVAVDLNEVVREALEITQARWREEAVSRGVMLEVRNDLAALPKVAGDPVELREALTNLILNAVDAMPGGGVLTLTTAVVDGEVAGRGDVGRRARDGGASRRRRDGRQRGDRALRRRAVRCRLHRPRDAARVRVAGRAGDQGDGAGRARHRRDGLRRGALGGGASRARRGPRPGETAQDPGDPGRGL